MTQEIKEHLEKINKTITPIVAILNKSGKKNSALDLSNIIKDNNKIISQLTDK